MADTENDQIENPTEQEEAPKEVTEEQAPAAEEAAEESDDDCEEYCCPAEFDEKEEMRKMFVGGLGKETTDEEFKELFVTFGEVTDFIIIRKENSKSDRLFGFITFAKCDDLEDCLLARPHKYKEKELDVKRAVPRGSDTENGHYKVKKLHVANIPAEFDSKVLKKYLKSRHPKKYGTIEEINLLKTKPEEGKAEKNRGFGFITVSSEDFADRMAIGESKFTLDGNSMRISKAKPRSADGGGRDFRKNQNQNYHHGGQGGYEDWSGYGGYGGGYDYYSAYGGYPGGYGGYPAGGYGGYGGRGGGRGGHRYNPY